MGKIKMMVCKRHGLTEYGLFKDGRYRCKQCSSERTTEIRHNIKLALVEYKGGKCEICGYDKCIAALEFHHINPDEKDFGISNGNIKSLEILKKEADKCLLVCNRCHKEIHYAEWKRNEEEKQKRIEENIKNFEKNCKKYSQDINDNYYKRVFLNIEDIINDLKNKLTYDVISKKYNVSVSTLKRFIYDNNIERMNSRRLKEFKVEEFIECAIDCKCNKTMMSKKIGVSVKSLEEWCVRNKIPRRKKDIIKYIQNKGIMVEPAKNSP